MSIELTVLFTFFSVLIGYQTYALNRTKLAKSDGQESAELKAELGYIRKGVDDIRIDAKANEKQLMAHGERITRVEESAKQAHKRLDNIEQKGEV